MYYAEYFRLKEEPFSIAPDPRYLFMSERHREALTHLLYGVVNGNGFVALTGEVGTGKTTLCNCLLDQLPETIDLALILNPRVNAEELLATVCDELGIHYPHGTKSLKILTGVLNEHLLKVHAQGRNTVLLIDEAQNLSFDVLEQIRLLTNLETRETKLLQIILVGQPELNQLLAQNNLRQLNQRITARYHIEPFSQPECSAYIEHRLRVAGSDRVVFSNAAVKKIYRRSGGVPRLINIICDRAMLGAYSMGTERIDAGTVHQAANEVLLDPSSQEKRIRMGAWGAVSALAILSLIGGTYFFAQFGNDFLRLLDARQQNAKTESPPDRAAPSEAVRQNRVYQDVFSDLFPAAKANLKFPTLNSGAERTDAPSQALLPGQAAGKKDSEVRDRQQKPRFIDLVANPKLSLFATLPRLFQRWNINNEPRDKNFCQAARRAGLRCLVQHGTWHYLLSLNRPATLEFSLRKGVNRYATLVGVEKGLAKFQFLNTESFSFPIGEVLPYWQGQFALLWKPPAPNVALLKRGDSNSSIAWLRKSLPPLPGDITRNPDSTFFDKELEDRVIAFQTENQLKPDGMVGTETVIFLNTANNDSTTPRLIQ